MTFLLDQNAPGLLARFIEPAGPKGSAVACSRGAALITYNRDDFLALAKPISMPASGYWSGGQPVSPNAAIFSTGCKPLTQEVRAATSILPQLV